LDAEVTPLGLIREDEIFGRSLDPLSEADLDDSDVGLIRPGVEGTAFPSASVSGTEVSLVRRSVSLSLNDVAVGSVSCVCSLDDDDASALEGSPPSAIAALFSISALSVSALSVVLAGLDSLR
jgi:hypothetical protein